jgi:hypothetical protein
MKYRKLSSERNLDLWRPRNFSSGFEDFPEYTEKNMPNRHNVELQGI